MSYKYRFIKPVTSETFDIGMLADKKLNVAIHKNYYIKTDYMDPDKKVYEQIGKPIHAEEITHSGSTTYKFYVNGKLVAEDQLSKFIGQEVEIQVTTETSEEFSIIASSSDTYQLPLKLQDDMLAEVDSRLEDGLISDSNSKYMITAVIFFNNAIISENKTKKNTVNFGITTTIQAGGIVDIKSAINCGKINNTTSSRTEKYAGPILGEVVFINLKKKRIFPPLPFIKKKGPGKVRQ